MTTIQASLPDHLYQETHYLVTQGWFRDENDFIIEAVRRYLETHRGALMEQFIREDVAWGLYGTE